MIWFILAMTIYFSVWTIIEPDRDEKKIYAAVTGAGLIALGIAAEL